MLIQDPPYSNCNTEEVTEIPLSFSISIQSDTACFAVAFPLTEPAWLIAPPYKRNFSVNVVLPASGCEIIAKVRRFFISSILLMLISLHSSFAVFYVCIIIIDLNMIFLSGLIVTYPISFYLSHIIFACSILGQTVLIIIQKCFFRKYIFLFFKRELGFFNHSSLFLIC